MSREEPNERRTTMRDVARQAGVSIATVSRALSGSPLVTEETRERVARIAGEAGYALNEAARNLRQKRTKAVEVLIPVGEYGSAQLSDPFFLSMIGGLAEALTAAGYDLLLSTSAPWTQSPPGGAARGSDAIASGRADGIIVIGQGPQRAGLLALTGRHDKVVVWGERVKGENYRVIGCDNEEGGRMAAAHLLSLGRRRIAFFAERGPPEIEARYRGYAAVLRGAGLQPLHLAPRGSGLDVRQLRDEVFMDPQIDGLFASSDALAIAAISALTAAGRRVPEDVSVVGYDGVPSAASVTPALSTIDQHLAEGAKALAKTAIALIEGKPASGRIFAPSLVIRGSCGAGPRGPG